MEEHSGKSALEHALNDGEDFELLFALNPEDDQRLLEAWPFETPVTRIGEIREGEVGIDLRLQNGTSARIDADSFEHRF